MQALDFTHSLPSSCSAYPLDCQLSSQGRFLLQITLPRVGLNCKPQAASPCSTARTGAQNAYYVCTSLVLMCKPGGSSLPATLLFVCVWEQETGSSHGLCARCPHQRATARQLVCSTQAAAPADVAVAEHRGRHTPASKLAPSWSAAEAGDSCALS